MENSVSRLRSRMRNTRMENDAYDLLSAAMDADCK